jgi:hypothetical protein
MVCRPEDQGGLVIEVKLLTEKGMWQQLLFNKYLKNQTLAQIEVKPDDSPFWKGLMRVKNDFYSGGFSKWRMDLILVFGRTFG